MNFAPIFIQIGKLCAPMTDPAIHNDPNNDLSKLPQLAGALLDRVSQLGVFYDVESRAERLQEVVRELESAEVWNDPERAQALGQERARLEAVVNPLTQMHVGLAETQELAEMLAEEDDQEGLLELSAELESNAVVIDRLEFQRMFSGEADANNAYVDIQAGSGGTEAQDWAEMLLRQYLRWGEKKGFKTELVEASAGDVAGIKSATIKFEGEYAYGWLRTETGVHRLVRKSPFDSSNRRHTSFASLFVSPEIDDNIDIDINPADLRVDVYRASGAGGQHVNKTESAVRITHAPSGVVVQSQSQRSQHQNRDNCMKQLRAKLFELEMHKRREEQDALEATKSDIGWGSQIRSYVLDQSRIKDLRTGHETGNTQAVLDGDLDKFIEASLKQGL